MLWGALMAVMASPTVAEAQLFPNLPTLKRSRIDCAEELPVYGMYRNKYYGYFPTCWRQFPPGWGCPSTESPDWQAELARRPIEMPEDDFGGPGGGPGGLDPFGGGLDDLLPDLPRQRSPFELDPPDAGASPFDPPRRAPSPFGDDPFGPAPAPAPGGGGTDRPASPFDFPGSSSAPSGVPAVSPPVTEAVAAPSDPIASLPQLPGLPELAVIPDARPRPVRLPAEGRDSAGVFGASALRGVEDGGLEGLQAIPGSVEGSSMPIVIAPDAPLGASGPIPGMVGGDRRGIILSEPNHSLGGPVTIDFQDHEHRPRRRILPSLFGRRN